MAEVDQIISFTFSSHHYIELKFDNLQNDSLNNGWTIQPLVKPCRVSSVMFQNVISVKIS